MKLTQINSNKFIDIDNIDYVDFLEDETCMIIFKSGHKLFLIDKHATSFLWETLNFVSDRKNSLIPHVEH